MRVTKRCWLSEKESIDGNLLGHYNVYLPIYRYGLLLRRLSSALLHASSRYNSYYYTPDAAQCTLVRAMSIKVDVYIVYYITHRITISVKHVCVGRHKKLPLYARATSLSFLFVYIYMYNIL